MTDKQPIYAELPTCHIDGYVREWRSGICTADEAMRGIAALAAQAPQPGYVLVPVEPTQEMLDAVVTTMDDHLLGPDAEKQYREDWAAMLAAAPMAPQQAAPQQEVQESEGATAYPDLPAESIGPFDVTQNEAGQDCYDHMDETWNDAKRWGVRLYTAEQMRAFADATHALRQGLAAQEPQQAAPAAEWLEQAYREGWAACRDAETIGQEAEDWAFGNSTANSRMIDMQQAAPQQEVQEPWGARVEGLVFVGNLPEHVRKLAEEHGWAIRWLYTAQPAPSGDAAIEEIIQDANRYRWLRRPLLHAGQGSIVVTMDDRAHGRIDRVIYLEALDAAIDAARKEGK